MPCGVPMPNAAGAPCRACTRRLRPLLALPPCRVRPGRSTCGLSQRAGSEPLRWRPAAPGGPCGPRPRLWWWQRPRLCQRPLPWRPPGRPPPPRRPPRPVRGPPRAPAAEQPVRPRSPAAAPAPQAPAAPAPRPSPDAGVTPPPASPVFAQGDLPEALRTQLPALKVTGATHSNNPAYRMAIVNGQVLHEGDQAAPGLVLEKIEPGRTVWSFKGYRYGVAAQ